VSFVVVNLLSRVWSSLCFFLFLYKPAMCVTPSKFQYCLNFIYLLLYSPQPIPLYYFLDIGCLYGNHNFMSRLCLLPLLYDSSSSCSFSPSSVAVVRVLYVGWEVGFIFVMDPFASSCCQIARCLRFFLAMLNMTSNHVIFFFYAPPYIHRVVNMNRSFSCLSILLTGSLNRSRRV